MTLNGSDPRKHTIAVLVENKFGVLSRVAGLFSARGYNAEPQQRAEILRTADIFRAKVVDVTPQSFTLEATGDEDKLEALLELLRPMGIQELVRTGKVAIARGPKTRSRKTLEAAKRPRVSDDPRVVGFAD